MPGQTDMSIVTAGYQCRPVSGTKSWSEHAYGRAIDIDPLQNPMIRGNLSIRGAGAMWLRRDRYRSACCTPRARSARSPRTASGGAAGGAP